MGRTVTVDEIQALCDLHKRGHSDEEIAERLGITARCVMIRRRNAGLPQNIAPAMIENHQTGHRWTVAEVRQLSVFRAKGLNYKEIAEKMSISQSAVGHKCRKLCL